MAARDFYEQHFSLEPQTVKLYVHLTFGSGTVTMTARPRNKGIASISRTSTGLYVLTLQDTYQRILGFSGVARATSGVPGAPIFAVKTDTVATTKTITFTTLNAGSGAAAAVVADAADTDIALIEITLSNSDAR